MAKKDTKLENLSKTVHMLVEEIRISETKGLDHLFMDVYSQQAGMMTDSRQQGKVKHAFKDILGIVFFGVLAGNLRYQGRDWMGMEPALYQLIDIRMNSVMNGITNSDGEYQALILILEIFATPAPRFPNLPERRGCLSCPARLWRPRFCVGRGTYYPYRRPAPHPVIFSQRESDSFHSFRDDAFGMSA